MCLAIHFGDHKADNDSPRFAYVDNVSLIRSQFYLLSPNTRVRFIMARSFKIPWGPELITGCQYHRPISVNDEVTNILQGMAGTQRL